MRDFFTHRFTASVTWHPAEAAPSRAKFSRAHTVSAAPAPPIPGSAARVFHGDPHRWNPEQLLLAAIAQCHMLSYLFLAHQSGISVAAYEDTAEGIIQMDPDGIGGAFASITLAPRVRITDPEHLAEAEALHAEAHRICIIARSTAAEIRLKPQIEI